MKTKDGEILRFAQNDKMSLVQRFPKEITTTMLVISTPFEPSASEPRSGQKSYLIIAPIRSFVNRGTRLRPSFNEESRSVQLLLTRFSGARDVHLSWPKPRSKAANAHKRTSCIESVLSGGCLKCVTELLGCWECPFQYSWCGIW